MQLPVQMDVRTQLPEGPHSGDPVAISIGPAKLTPSTYRAHPPHHRLASNQLPHHPCHPQNQIAYSLPDLLAASLENDRLELSRRGGPILSVPDFQSFVLPVLQETADGKEHAIAEIRQRLPGIMGLSSDDLEETLPSGAQTKFRHRTHWSAVYLVKAGALHRPRRGALAITERGRQLLAQGHPKITVKLLRQFPEFQEFYKGGSSENSEETSTSVSSRAGDLVETPEERLDSSFKEIQSSLREELLEIVKKSSPKFFESLVVDLLVAMGYGGSIEDAGRAVGRSGDDGIDGIIKEDKLGLDVVYVQAKKWNETVVGRPVVQAFAGSPEGQRARKGVIITTSSFSQDARDYVLRIEKKIVLIDGKQLAELMIEHSVGVAIAKTYTLKKIDHDFFEPE